jgi:hypothetical protein
VTTRTCVPVRKKVLPSVRLIVLELIIMLALCSIIYMLYYSALDNFCLSYILWLGSF